MGSKKGERQLRVPLPVIILVMTALTLTGLTAARYVSQKSGRSIFSAQDFYFTSNLLMEESENAVYFVDPEKDLIVKINNFADPLRSASGTIQYVIDVQGGSAGLSSGTLTEQKQTEEIVITPQDSETELISVTVTSTAPYTKVLKAEFYRKKGNQYMVEDSQGSRAAVLTMVCTDASKEITVKLPEGVIPDENNSQVVPYENNECVFLSPGYGIYSLNLLKTDLSFILTSGGSNTFASEITIAASN